MLPNRDEHLLELLARREGINQEIRSLRVEAMAGETKTSRKLRRQVGRLAAKLYDLGVPYAEIGAILDVERQRAHQIVARARREACRES